MAGETINVQGSYTNILTSATVNSAAISGESDSIATALSAAEEVYTKLDFKAVIITTTPTAGAVLDLYRRPSDGTTQAPAPTASYKPHYCGSFTLTNSIGHYYLYGVVNSDENDTFYVINNDASANLPIQLLVRGKTYNGAP